MFKFASLLALSTVVACAQVRITQAVDDQQRVRLPGNRHPLAAES